MKFLGLFFTCSLFLSSFSSAEVIYSNDFSEAAGRDLSGSALITPGLKSKIYNIELDGNGHMSSSVANAGSSLRVQLSSEPIAASEIKLTAVLRTPSIGGTWVGIGFLEDGLAGAGFTVSGANSGPWLQFSSGGVRIRGGHGTSGSAELHRIKNLPYEAGDTVTAELTYYTKTATVDFLLNGTVIAKGLVVTHTGGIEDGAIIKWVEINLCNELPSAKGGAYIDRLAVETSGRVAPAETPVTALPQRDANTLWIDAAAFQQTGGWLLDTQFVHLMGAPYLIAAGVGTPVENAQVVFEINEPGTYRLWVRSRNWMQEHSPGQFQIQLDGKGLIPVFGKADSDEWIWEPAGSVMLAAGMHTIGLNDQTGYYGRCAALILSKDTQYVPPDELAAFREERARLTGVSLEPVDLGEYDVIVVGGGAAGCPTALASARTGAQTALVHNRAVLGGNASVELGVPVQGASLHQSYARESGICEELGRVKARYSYPKMTKAFALAAEAEPNLTVFLNLHVYDAVMDGSRITAVKAFNTLTGEECVLKANQFVDTTGDGWLGYFAGADYRIGREAQDEYNESLAPKEADSRTMSGCLMGNLKLGYGWKKTEVQAPYTPPPWAYNLPPNPEFGRSISFLSGQWWLEHPNDIDDIWHAEQARDELLRIVFGYWDFIKNKWKKKDAAENALLTYVPVTEAKRESRRLMGDLIVNQNDVESARNFSDTIGHAGWSLDIHHPEGILSGRGGPYDFDRLVPQNNIPFRSLYSRNIENLLFAGRCMSVSHVALGTVRVEGTCAVTGQAAGTAAAMCAAKGINPRTLATQHIGELQQQLLLDDQYVPGISNSDPTDLARKAIVTASSKATCDWVNKSFLRPNTRGALHLWARYGLIYPTGSEGRIGDLYLYVHSPLKEEKVMSIKIHALENSRSADFSSRPLLAEEAVQVPAGHRGYVKISPQCSVPTPFFAIEVAAKCGLRLSGAKRGHLGTRLMWERDITVNIGRPAVMMYTDPPLHYPRNYSASNVISGISRIVEQESNMWRSDPEAALPQWIELKWNSPQTISRIHLTFDTDLDSVLHKESVPAEVVTAYEVQIYTATGWQTVVSETNNYQRFRRHRFDSVETDRLRVVINKTGGALSARIYEVRVY